jgi:hypothetical protein
MLQRAGAFNRKLVLCPTSSHSGSVNALVLTACACLRACKPSGRCAAYSLIRPSQQRISSEPGRALARPKRQD